RLDWGDDCKLWFARRKYGDVIVAKTGTESSIWFKENDSHDIRVTLKNSWSDPAIIDRAATLLFEQEGAVGIDYLGDRGAVSSPAPSGTYFFPFKAQKTQAQRICVQGGLGKYREIDTALENEKDIYLSNLDRLYRELVVSGSRTQDPILFA